MDAICFFHGMQTPEPKYPDYLVNSFDYLLTLYQIIGHLPIQSMQVLSDIDGAVQYQIQFVDRSSIESLANWIAQSQFTIMSYGNTYHIEMNTGTDTNTTFLLQKIA